MRKSIRIKSISQNMVKALTTSNTQLKIGQKKARMRYGFKQ